MVAGDEARKQRNRNDKKKRNENCKYVRARHTDARNHTRDDGNTFRRSHAVRKRLLVGDIAYGWAYTWPQIGFVPSGKLAYAHYVQSREFEGEERNHGFGSVTLSIEF